MDWSLVGFQGLNDVQNIHPAFVHFPIALFPTALFFFGIGLFKKEARLLFAGRICLLLGFLSSIVSVASGLIAAESFPHSESVHRMILMHQKIGYAVLTLGGVLSVWSFILKGVAPRLPKLFFLSLLFATFMVLQNGHLGGMMFPNG